MNKIQMIVAFDQNFAIGVNGKLPFKSKTDMAWFTAMTENKTVIMGGKTWDSLGGISLKNRHNIVISSRVRNYTAEKRLHLMGLSYYDSPEVVMEDIRKGKIESPIIIGGATLYDWFLPITERFFITEVIGEYEADTYFPIAKMEELDLQTNWSSYHVGENGEPDLLFKIMTKKVK